MGGIAGILNSDGNCVEPALLEGMLQAIARWYDDTGSLTPAQVATRYADLALATLGVSPEVRARVAAAR